MTLSLNLVHHFSHLTLAILLLSLCLLIADGQVVSLGKCPYMPVVADFNPSAFLGLWYEQRKYPNLFQIGGKCNTAEYSMKHDGTLSIINRHENKLTGIETGEHGYGRMLFPGKLKVRFPQPWKSDAPYFIIGTDYSNYAVVVTCSEYGLVNGKIAWILTRHRYPSQKVMHKAYTEMEHANLSVAFLKKTDQNHCHPVGQPLDNFIKKNVEG
ncbi:apolipoprotein D-like [Ochlerotatus camptorhynchus]|uniref:apolipoprotein D-like n=1 Tax=Ochlerotatus camptorhynchus TaxID=644619 RepID=UPI0031DCBB6A